LEIRTEWPGYVELPYTLPQDSTMFLLMREPNTEIWFNKLDWIARHGGMALLNVHPDYLDFDPQHKSAIHYPLDRYESFLRHARERYRQSLLERPSHGRSPPGSKPLV
jgi:hypothetical protein